MAYLQKFKINKYSLYELKVGIDSVIECYLNIHDFDENLKLNNMKIIFVILAIACAGIAHLFTNPFPESYYILLFTIIFYLIFRSTYWLIEKKLTGTVFYMGTNLDYCKKYRKNRRYTIKEIKVNSKIDVKNPSIYEIWFDFVTTEENKIFISKKKIIKCTQIYDERGYINIARVMHSFKSILKKELKKIE